MSHLDIQLDRRAFARVRRTPAYRSVSGAWDSPVIIACSGGADSVALLATASVAGAAGRVHPFCVAHVDHGTRPETADEGRFVARLAAAFGHPFVSLTVAGAATDNSGGPEAGLRAIRYQSLARLAARLGASAVITAHTKDDQVETILLRLLSGASALAVAGMRPVQVLETEQGALEVRRPLLGVSRSELHGVLEMLGLPHCEDPSNEDLSYRRNRLRHRIIPELERLDPGFGDGLIRAVHQASEDALVVDEVGSRAFERHVRQGEGQVWIDRSFLLEASEAVGSRVVRDGLLLLLAGDTRELTHERIVAIVRSASGRTGARIELPYGFVALVERDEVVIGPAGNNGVGDG